MFPLFLEEFVDVLKIVHRIVDEELQFGDDAQLEPYACAQFVAYACVLLVDGIQNFFRTFRGEYADVGAADAHVGADVGLGDADNHSVHAFGILLEDVAEFFLYES